MTPYYVYAYLREDGSPYYIGKGKGNRAWTKGKSEINKPIHKENIVILHENLTNDEAKEIEISLIQQIGRKDLGTGILRNLTSGGDGASLAGSKNGMFGRTKEQHHLYGKKRPDISGTNNPMFGRKGELHPAYGYTHCAEQREKISASKVGVKRVNFAQSGEKNPMFGKKGKDNPNFGIKHDKIACPTCGKLTSNAMFTRWHKNDKCIKKDSKND